MQKTIFAATLVAALGMGSAQAADLRTTGSLKDAPEYMPASTWTGFYLGVGGGGGAVNHDLKANEHYQDRESSSNSGINLNGIGGMGGFGTVQVGYDRQLDQHFVVGVFFDYDFSNIESSLTVNVDGDSAKISHTLTDSWTVGGRVGYLVNANTLVYGLAGYTEAHFDTSAPIKLPSSVTNGDFSGWTAGAGIETNLGGSWFLKGEYRFTSLDEKTLLSGDILSGGRKPKTIGNYSVTDQPDIQTGRLVLVYKLNGVGPESLK
jgi:outer membrane immunogenic protein